MPRNNAKNNKKQQQQKTEMTENVVKENILMTGINWDTKVVRKEWKKKYNGKKKKWKKMRRDNEWRKKMDEDIIERNQIVKKKESDEVKPEIKKVVGGG